MASKKAAAPPSRKSAPSAGLRIVVTKSPDRLHGSSVHLWHGALHGNGGKLSLGSLLCRTQAGAAKRFRAIVRGGLK